MSINLIFRCMPLHAGKSLKRYYKYFPYLDTTKKRAIFCQEASWNCYENKYKLFQQILSW